MNRFYLVISFFLSIMAMALLPADMLAMDSLRGKPKKLTLKEAIDLALQQKSNVKLLSKTDEASYANKGILQSGFYPPIQTNLTYTRATANFAPRPGLVIPGLNTGPENNTTYPNYNASLLFTQLLYDFGQLSSLRFMRRKRRRSLPISTEKRRWPH